MTAPPEICPHCGNPIDFGRPPHERPVQLSTGEWLHFTCWEDEHEDYGICYDDDKDERG